MAGLMAQSKDRPDLLQQSNQANAVPVHNPQLA